jgi:S-layer protein
VADTTSDATILAHSVTLSHFADGVGGDVIDLSAITNGSPTSSVDITGYIVLSAPATLKEALDLAAAGNGSSTATVVTFQFGGDTYVLADNSASHTLTTDDVVVKLTGTHTLSDASNITF